MDLFASKEIARGVQTLSYRAEVETALAFNLCPSRDPSRLNVDSFDRFKFNYRIVKKYKLR
jgi:hypothetical protein